MPQKKKAEDKYTDVELRDGIKEELMQSDKGGKAGQWSARKAQFLASEYKKRGGEYKTDKKDQDETQQHLDEWTEEDWQTKEGSGNAKKPDGTEKRYLPKKAWDKMTEEEKEETEELKAEGQAAGQQHVENTSAAKKARKSAQKRDRPSDAEKDISEPPKKTTRSTRSKNSREADEQADDEPPSKGKRKSSTRSKGISNTPRDKPIESTGDKAEKANEAKHGKPGSVDRIPKKGQIIFWRAMPGMCKGEVVEVLTTESTINGKKVKASKDDPRVKAKSHGPSGKIAIHKLDNCYWKDE